MPPTVGGRYAPQHMSNPFAQLNQHHLQQQSQHLQHPGGLQSQNFGAQPGFGAHGTGIFSPSNAGSSLHNAGAFGPTSLGSGVGGPGGGGGGSGLASHAAQMGFHGAGMGNVSALAQQDHSNALSTATVKGANSRVREVWKSNLAQEMQLLRSLVDRYPYISMDTEFPGVIARPMGEFTTKASYHYQTLRCNVDLLRIIQLGITLFSVEGDIPPAQPIETSSLLSGNGRNGFPTNLQICPCTWQFNFQFDMENDMYNSDSITVLKKAGVRFEKSATDGIDPQDFGSLLITSGLTMSDDVTWLSFHSGYDFAYLIKLMWNQSLPTDEEAWRQLLRIFFPSLYDVKFLLRNAQKIAMAGPTSSQRSRLAPTAANLLNELGTKSGLQDLADLLGCQRMGTAHQAGSDAWLTGLVFFTMKDKIFSGQIPDEMNGEIWGLTSVGAPASAATQAAAIAAAGAATSMQTGGVNGDRHSGFGNAQGINFSPYGQQEGAGPRTPTNQQAGPAGTVQHGSGTPGPFGQFHTGHGGPLTTPQGGVFGQFQHPQK